MEIPYRVVNVAAGDLVHRRAKNDIEAWFPGQQAYREITSCSNTTDFQARRLKVRMRTDKGMRWCTPSTGPCAVGRTILALLENHQQPDGSVVIPEALRLPYRVRCPRAVSDVSDPIFARIAARYDLINGILWARRRSGGQRGSTCWRPERSSTWVVGPGPPISTAGSSWSRPGHRDGGIEPGPGPSCRDRGVASFREGSLDAVFSGFVFRNLSSVTDTWPRSTGS